MFHSLFDPYPMDPNNLGPDHVSGLPQVSYAVVAVTWDEVTEVLGRANGYHMAELSTRSPPYILQNPR